MITVGDCVHLLSLSTFFTRTSCPHLNTCLSSCLKEHVYKLNLNFKRISFNDHSVNGRRKPLNISKYEIRKEQLLAEQGCVQKYAHDTFKYRNC